MCTQYDLDRVDFTQILGRRQHFLAGAGKTVFTRPQRMVLSDRLAVSWYGTLTDHDRASVRKLLQPVAELAEKELSHA